MLQRMNIDASQNSPMQGYRWFAALVCGAVANGLDASQKAIPCTDGILNVEDYGTVGWVEYFLVLILILMNVFITYAIVMHISRTMRGIKRALIVVFSSMLLLLVWTGFSMYRALPYDSSSLVDLISTNYNWAWLAAVFVICIGLLLCCCHNMRKKPCIKMAASSKMVCLNGEWISIEEYLLREMGIEVSHGMTKEELDEALRKYRDDTTTYGIPRPTDSK